MELYPIDIAIHLINIVVTYVLLRALIWKPVRKFMADREARVQAQLDEAARLKNEAEASRAAYEAKLAEAQASCESILAEGRKQAAISSQQTLEQAQKEAQGILSRARTEAQNEAQRVMDDSKEELAELAVELAGRVLRFEDEVCSRLAQGRKDRQGFKKGVLKTAKPLQAGELESITGQLSDLLGCSLELEPQVDPALIGGYAAYIDGRVYDFSYAAQLTAMRQKLA